MDDVTALRDGLLREVSRHDRHIIASMLDALIATVEAKRSVEVAALAEALEEIAERGPGTWFGQRARAALAQTPPTDAGERCAACGMPERSTRPAAPAPKAFALALDGALQAEGVFLDWVQIVRIVSAVKP